MKSNAIVLNECRRPVKTWLPWSCFAFNWHNQFKIMRKVSSDNYRKASHGSVQNVLNLFTHELQQCVFTTVQLIIKKQTQICILKKCTGVWQWIHPKCTILSLENNLCVLSPEVANRRLFSVWNSYCTQGHSYTSLQSPVHSPLPQGFHKRTRFTGCPWLIVLPAITRENTIVITQYTVEANWRPLFHKNSRN